MNRKEIWKQLTVFMRKWRIRNRLRSLMSQNNGLGTAIALLRESGFDKGLSIELLIEAGASYEEAKVAVHQSSVWADARQQGETRIVRRPAGRDQ